MNIIFIKTAKIFTITLFMFVVATLTNAQIPNFGNIISFKVSPKNPGPNQTVTVSTESFSVDLDRADQIIWSINGKVVARKAGIKQIQFDTGSLGSRSDITVTALGTKLGTVSENIIISPTEVDLLWEADSYTPPFYKGKALPASDAEITIVAIPQFVTPSGRKLDSDDMVFTWKKDRKVLGNESGRGKDSITIKGPKIFNNSIIQVEVSSVGNLLQGSGAVVISANAPRIVFYRNDPVLGIRYEEAISDTEELFDDEVTITAHPYFISSKNRVDSDTEYNWRVNGSKVNSSPEDESSIVLRQVGEGRGVANISLSIQNFDKILQSARAGFSVLFGRNDNTSFDF